MKGCETVEGGERRSAYGGDASLVFSQIHRKNWWEQRRGKETSTSGVFFFSESSLHLSSAVDRRRVWLTGTEEQNGRIQLANKEKHCASTNRLLHKSLSIRPLVRLRISTTMSFDNKMILCAIANCMRNRCHEKVPKGHDSVHTVLYRQVKLPSNSHHRGDKFPFPLMPFYTKNRCRRHLRWKSKRLR